MARQRLHAGNPLPSKDGLREGIETIAIVAVMVLLLKMFVAEAFVIPTGSMATTLLGAHKTATCPQCGYEFPVNCSSERELRAGMEHDAVVGCVCPNCRYQIDFRHEGVNPACVSGDRLVVGKFLYDLHLNRVERQDVVVFKYPENPQRHHEAINYIKRLIGRPGETVAIHQGDLYVYPGPKNGQAMPLTYANHPRPADSKESWQSVYMYPDDPEAVALFRQGKFEIVRKSPDKVLALRRLVYDNDHQAKDLLDHGFPPRWAPENGVDETTASRDSLNYLQARKEAEQEAAWVPDSSHGFRHPARNGKLAWLRYRHLLAERSPETGLTDTAHREGRPELITDFMGYDSWRSAWGGGHSSPPPNWVGDLILECEVHVEPLATSSAELVLELSKGVDRFQARWDVSSGQCTLVRVTGSKEERLESRPTGLRPGRSHFLRFANVDEKLMVWVDRSLPFGNGVEFTSPREHGPFANDLRPASIAAQSAALSVRKLKLWRDTYYTLRPGSSDAAPTGDDWSNPDKWRVLRELPVETIYVQPGHYLCLGDNSPESADSRSWGLVPERLLLGKALLVYYPFRRAGPIK